jgi:flagellar basal body-associated protein FliL
MHLRRIDIFAILATLLIVVVFGYVFFFRRQAVSAEHVYDSAQQALNIVIASRQAEILAGNDPELLGDIDEIHILTLGIDSRKEGNEKHCDL